MNTWYNLHVYIERNEILHVVTYNRKYIKIVNSSNFFLWELEEMKSCIYCVETANNGMRLQWFWHHRLVLMLEETGSTERVCKIQLLTRGRNHYPTLTVHIAGLRIYNGKSLIGKNWNIIEEKNHGTDT